MSLIFQSLQKLKSKRNTAFPVESGSAPRQKHMTAKPLFPMRVTLVGLGLVLALGCGTVYAVQVLKQRVEAEQLNPVIEKQRYAIIARNEESVSARPDEPPYDLSPPDLVAQPIVTMTTEVQAQFYPPEPKANAADQSQADQQATHNPVPLVTANPVSETPDDMQTVAKPSTDSKKDRPSSVQKQPVVDAAVEAAERARRATLEKNARIGRLVRSIEQALAGAPHAGDPKALLAQLAQLKGQDHPYVMKLRAYWNFQHGRYTAAEADLRKVIAIYPDDLEAGINLALIEIQGQRFTEALDRLKRLRNNYPDSPMIAELIKRLN